MLTLPLSLYKVLFTIRQTSTEIVAPKKSRAEIDATKINKVVVFKPNCAECVFSVCYVLVLPPWQRSCRNEIRAIIDAREHIPLSRCKSQHNTASEHMVTTLDQKYSWPSDDKFMVPAHIQRHSTVCTQLCVFVCVSTVNAGECYTHSSNRGSGCDNVVWVSCTQLMWASSAHSLTHSAKKRGEEKVRAQLLLTYLFLPR